MKLQTQSLKLQGIHVEAQQITTTANEMKVKSVINAKLVRYLADWCLTELSAQISQAYIMPQQYDIYDAGPGTKYSNIHIIKR